MALTQDEIAELTAYRDVLRELLRSVNIELVSAKAKLNELLDRWEKIYKEYQGLDRKIAMETKLTIIKTKSPAMSKRDLTPGEAQELLNFLATAFPVPEKESLNVECEEEIEFQTDSTEAN